MARFQQKKNPKKTIEKPGKMKQPNNENRILF